VSARPLVVGYGNSLRGDDGIGAFVGALLASDSEFSDADVVSVHQLTPELADDFARASRIVLIDAAVNGRPAGAVEVVPVSPAGQPSSVLTHHVDARVLLALTAELYGVAPPAVVVTVSLAQTDLGEHLSHAMTAALPEIIETVSQLIREPAHA
jgi:hydrogenase maturation protease